MEKIDFKIFVPRGENNYVRLDKETEFEVDIYTINIYQSEDKVTYWFYFKIPCDDEHHKNLLKKGQHPQAILLIGNNPYEIYGDAEIMNTSFHKWEQQIQITVLFTVLQAHKTVDNPRKEVKPTRVELMDL